MSEQTREPVDPGAMPEEWRRGYECGRREAIAEAASYLRLHCHPHAANIIERHEAEQTPAERTPETVLRAMLASYERTALDATVAFFRALKAGQETSGLSANVIDQQSRRETVFDMLAAAIAIADEDLLRVAGILPGIAADYSARLAGTRPLDAPPPETP